MSGTTSVNPFEVLFFFASGFIAQLIDGSIGMCFGILCTTLLMSVGIEPALASGVAHISEVFTTAASGASHFKLGNIRRGIVFPLVLSGVIGGGVGAALCVFLSAKAPIIFTILVSILLGDMGVIILDRFIRRKPKPSTGLSHEERSEDASEVVVRPWLLSFLGLFASFTDAIGGGGWGPIATPTLILEGVEPHKVVGSINLTEFFVTMVEAATFIVLLPTIRWDAVLFLLIGGVIAAPFAALLCKKLPVRSLGLLIGVTLIILSARNILKAAGLI